MVNLKSLGKFLDFSICYLDKSTHFVQLDTLDLFASTHFLAAASGLMPLLMSSMTAAISFWVQWNLSMIL